jgi:glutathione peroxidase
MTADAAPPGSVYDYTMTSLEGKEVPLASYKGKVLLIVNVASRCGNTPQYAGLEALWKKYGPEGLVVMGFPSNDFGKQEPGTDAEIGEFCSRNYGVTFPMFSKIVVRGEEQHPLYRYLTSPGSNPEFSGDVKWNFQKYLIGRDGAILGKFAPKTEPLSPEIESAVTAALAR